MLFSSLAILNTFCLNAWKLLECQFFSNVLPCWQTSIFLIETSARGKLLRFEQLLVFLHMIRASNTFCDCIFKLACVYHFLAFLFCIQRPYGTSISRSSNTAYFSWFAHVCHRVYWLLDFLSFFENKHEFEQISCMLFLSDYHLKSRFSLG